MEGIMSNYLERFQDVNMEDLPNGRKTLPPISSVLRLDTFFEDKNNSIEEIFDNKELTKVQDLSMQANCLYKLPENLTKNLKNLMKLNLSYNDIEELDVSLITLNKLEELIIDKNRLVELPNYLGELCNLKLIKARGNKIAKVPESLNNLVNLEEIDFSDNKIQDIPETWERLGSLKIVNLSFNEFRSAPKCIIQGSPRLEKLDLSKNLISQFSLPPLSNDLRQFYFNNNPKNDQFPAWLFTEKFSKLEELILDETVFESFNFQDDRFAPLNIKKLSMIQCGLSDTDFERISQSMIKLEHLNIGNNSKNNEANVFWVMPVRNLKNPKRLEELNVQAAGLPALPQEINTLENLIRLDVSQNNISSLPEEICELTRLEFLNAARNNLYALPQGLGNLKALKIMFLESNRLSSLPDSIKNLQHLRCLDLYNNEFLEVPKQLEIIPNLKALDIDGNVFKTDNLQIANIHYLNAKNLLRSTSNLLLLRSNDPKVLDEADNESMNSFLDYEEELGNGGNKSLIDTNLSDIVSEENWNISEDSADEYDPTAKPRNCLVYSPFTVSSVFYYGNFCPADLHSTRIRDQLAAMQGQQAPLNIEEGQFDDA